MQKHIGQASHNLKFHRSIEPGFPGSFHDWKITVLFYAAIHCMKALAASKGIQIGNTHQEIEQSVNPDRNGAAMRISRGAWRDYKSLYTYSRTARYNGMTDPDTFEQIQQNDHAYCLRHLESFKKYIRQQGVPLQDEDSNY